MIRDTHNTPYIPGVMIQIWCNHYNINYVAKITPKKVTFQEVIKVIDNRHLNQCPFCEGTGNVFDNEYPWEKDCPDCDGTGINKEN